MLFKTIKTKCSAEHFTHRSRFIGYAAPANNTESAQSFIHECSILHADATHCCWAYRIGFPGTPLEYFSDDGEPSGTAGRPILGAIKQYELQNIALAVIRYFGGVKLGIRGLIDAYSTTAGITLESAGIITTQPFKVFNIEISYSIYDIIKHEIEVIGGTISNPAFEEKIKCVCISACRFF